MISDNYIRLFENSIKQNWALDAFTDYVEKRTVSYGEVAKNIAKVHVFFHNIGFEKGDKVALIGKNGIDWCTIYLATITYGGVIVPILQDFNPRDVQHIINHSDAELLFVSQNIWDNINEEDLLYIRAAFTIEGTKMLFHKEDDQKMERTVANLDVLFAEAYPNGFSASDVLYPTIPNSELACISYTSGTTGYSKGVLLSGNALAGNMQFAMEIHEMHVGSRVLSFLPLAHAFGCAFDFLACFAAGGHATFLGRIPSPKIILRALADVKPTIIFSVPLIIEKIYTKQIRPLLQTNGMRWALNIPFIDKQVLATVNKKLTETFGGEFSQVIIGGAPMNPEAEAFFKKIGFHFTVGYGMTECAPLISYTYWADYKMNSVGKILPHMEAKILSSDPQNEAGEILVRGEHLMMGYYKNEEATRAAIDSEGWLHTGDIGTMDFDGTLYIRGRNKNMLLGPSGQNIYPEEIEAKLNNMPYVLESLVVQSSDNKLTALVVPDYSAIDADKMSHSDIVAVMEENRKELNKKTASYDNISAIEIHPAEFEKTPKKSIKRFLYTGKR